MNFLPQNLLANDPWEAMHALAYWIENRSDIVERLTEWQLNFVSLAGEAAKHADREMEIGSDALDNLDVLADLCIKVSDSIYVEWDHEQFAFIPQVRWLSDPNYDGEVEIVNSPAWGSDMVNGKPVDDWEEALTPVLPYLFINERGNATLYVRDEQGQAHECWSVV